VNGDPEQLQLRDAQYGHGKLWVEKLGLSLHVVEIQVTGLNGDSDTVRLTREQALELIDFLSDIVITRER
jgi:hypothetical protein